MYIWKYAALHTITGLISHDLLVCQLEVHQGGGLILLERLCPLVPTLKLFEQHLSDLYAGRQEELELQALLRDCYLGFHRCHDLRFDEWPLQDAAILLKANRSYRG